MEENEAIERIKYRMYTAGQVAGENGMEDLEMAIKALEEIWQYRAIGTPEECRAAVEKQTAIPRELIEGKYFCQKCHNLMPYPGYCGCGQKVY